MSSASHSLTFSPSVNPRNSLGSQLPLPTTQNTTPMQRPQGGTTISSVSRPNSPNLHSRKLSTLSRDPHQSSPTTSAFPTSPSNHISTTHAGGIQPSASFFRPSRPNQQQQHYPRPLSALSASSQSHADHSDHFQLAPLANTQTNGTAYDTGESVFDVVEPLAEDSRHFTSFTRMKQSREPLLPITGRPGGLSSRPATRDRSGSNVTSPATPGRSATSRLVRNSFDRVLTLSRGLSFDSIRKSTRQSTDGRPTFESKVSDEDGDLGMPSTPTTPSHKHSPSPVRFNGMNLSTSVSRHSASHATSSPSPELLFIPHAPKRNPPLSAIPAMHEGKPVRNFQYHPSRNRFLYNGHLLTGGEPPWAFIASFTLWLVLAGVWFGTTTVWWWHNESPAVAAVGIYMALVTISCMLATATLDPGILPRNLDPDPPYPNTSPSDGGVRLPMPRDLKVRSDVVRVKYCSTCKTYRPPRSSHCKMCDNCVDGCDHHCQWVNNCVGRRNYTTFFTLLLFATLTLILIICTSALHLYFLTKREGLDFKHALRKGAGSAVAFCLAIAVIWPVAALLTYHMRLLLFNITTIEQIRNQAHKSLVPGPPPPNPFSHGSWRRNVLAILCRPQGFSWLNGAAFATDDKREINPGLLEWDSMGRTQRDER